MGRAAAVAFALSIAIGPACASEVRQTDGEVTVLHGAASAAAAAGMLLDPGDEIETGPASEALVEFDDGAKMVMRPGTRVVVEEHVAQPGRSLRLQLLIARGTARFVSGARTQHHLVSLRTQTATIGIRGTDVEIAVLPQRDNAPAAGTYLRVNRGAAEIRAADGSSVLLAPGDVATSLEQGSRSRSLGPSPLAHKLERVPQGLFPQARLDDALPR